MCNHALRVGRQRATARMDGRDGRKRSHMAFRARHVRACRQACCQRRLLLHRVRLPRYAPASLRQARQQGVGAGAGHLRPAEETPIRVHTIQVSGAVRGCGDGIVLQSFPLLRPECGELYQPRPDWVGRRESYFVFTC